MIESQLINEIHSISLKISKVTSKEGFFDLACYISYQFQTTTENELKDFFECKGKKRALYDEILWQTLSNEYFLKCVFEVMQYANNETLSLRNRQAIEWREFYQGTQKESEAYRKLKLKHKKEQLQLVKDLRESKIEEKEAIQIALHMSFLCISFSKKNLSEQNIKHIGYQVNALFRNILLFQNNQFDKLAVIKFLNQVSFDSKYHTNKKYPSDLIGKIVDKTLFSHLTISRHLIGTVFITLSQSRKLSQTFKKTTYLLDKKENYKIAEGIQKLAKEIIFIDSSLAEYKNAYEKKFNNSFYIDFVEKIRRKTDSNTLFILKEMILPLKYSYSDQGKDLVYTMINSSETIMSKVVEYFQKNFSAFTTAETNDNDWSNKLFLVSIKTLSVMVQISKSKNDIWTMAVFMNEYLSWINQVNQILNKNILEDDWDILKKYLIQENTIIEWKSTFYTPTQELFISDGVELAKGKEIFQNIIKPILGMLNTDGGTILVGVVENPNAIIRKDIRDNIIKRDGYSLFDISYELEKKKKDIDTVKREIQDCLFAKTGYTAEKFNGLWDLQILEVKDDFKTVNIVKLNVKKSDDYIYTRETINNKKSYSLLKRADGRTIEVDIDSYLIKQKSEVK